MFGFYGFDTLYVFLVLPCILLSLWANNNVSTTFHKYSTQLSRRNITAVEAAVRVRALHRVGRGAVEFEGGADHDLLAALLAVVKGVARLRHLALVPPFALAVRRGRVGDF